MLWLPADQRLAVALMIALGIGLHNLGEGLAIGASFSVGAAALGTFLVIGLITQSITEGLGIIAPVLKDSPSVENLAAMGLLQLHTSGHIRCAERVPATGEAQRLI